MKFVAKRTYLNVTLTNTPNQNLVRSGLLKYPNYFKSQKTCTYIMTLSGFVGAACNNT